MRAVGLNEITRGRIARLSGTPYKGNLLALQRPHGIAIRINTWSDEAHAFPGNVVETNERVVATSRRKDETRAVRRPLLRMILTANDKLLGLFRGFERGEPDLSIADISDGAARRNLGRIADINLLGFAAAPGNAPDSLFSSRGIAGGIRKLTGGILAFAAHVDYGGAVVGEIQVRDRAAVIFQIGSEFASSEGWPFSDPDVAPALLIESPGNAADLLCGGEIFREWHAEQVFEGEAFLRVAGRCKT